MPWKLFYICFEKAESIPKEMQSLVLAQFFINIPIIPIPFLLLVIYLSMGHEKVIFQAVVDLSNCFDWCKGRFRLN
ncbi:hypothetical protein CFP56_035419 [Quercus suber]|uniref:Uncharacterized protein n=1 Tax=Quercus suber TaxID=58331 RepID=A0AAW0JA15_QUESU